MVIKCIQRREITRQDDGHSDIPFLNESSSEARAPTDHLILFFFFFFFVFVFKCDLTNFPASRDSFFHLFHFIGHPTFNELMIFLRNPSSVHY